MDFCGVKIIIKDLQCVHENRNVLVVPATVEIQIKCWVTRVNFNRICVTAGLNYPPEKHQSLLVTTFTALKKRASDCLHLRNQCLTGQSISAFYSPRAVDSLCCVIERLGPDLGVSGGPCPSFLLRRVDNAADTPMKGQIGAWIFSQNEHLNNGNRCV